MIKPKSVVRSIVVLIALALLPALSAAATLAVAPTSTTAGAAVTVTWNAIASPTSTDWIGLYAAGAADTGYLSWMYVSCSNAAGAGSASGNCPFGLPGSLGVGSYEFRLFTNNGYTRLATSGTLTVTGGTTGTTLTASPSIVAQGAAVTATWTAIGSPTSTDWIALYASGAGDGSYLNWIYVSCSRTAGSAAAGGSCPLVVPGGLPNGTYELRLFASNGFSRLATSNGFAVSPVTTRTLTVGSSNPLSGVALTITPNDNNSQGNGTTPQFTRTYNNNTAVTLTAPSTSGTYGFSNWSGCDSVSGTPALTCNVTMSADKGVTAVYSGTDSTPPHTSISTGPTGTISANSATFTWTGSDDVTPVANLVYAYKLVGVDANFTSFSSATTASYSNLSNQSYTFIVEAKDQAGNIDATPPNRSFTVNFVVTHVLTVASTNPAAGVSVTVSPIDNNGAGTGSTQFTRTYNNNAAVTLTAPSSNFSSWTGCDSVSGVPAVTCNVTLGADKAVTAGYTVPPGPTITSNFASVAPGSAPTATWSGIVSPTSTDWIALATAGAANNSYLNWTYVSCTQAAGAAKAAGSCSLTVPSSTASGIYELRLFANNTYTRLATSTSITVAPVAIGSSTLAATLGVSYSQNLSATGGTGSYTWSQVSGSVPGLNLSSAGVISGTPTQSGNNFSFTAKAVDSLGASATRSFTVVVSPSSVLALASSVLTSAQVNVLYTFNLGATGGTAPYTYSIPSGGLPLGLSLSSSGVISGIPYSIGSRKFVVQVKDSVNATASGTLILTARSSGIKPLRGYWSFDDGTATDNSGFNPGSTLVGSPQVVPGISGNALRLDGVSQYVNASDFDLDAGSGELSIFAWVRTTQAGGLKMIVALRDSSSSTNPGYQLFQNSNNALSYIIADTSGNVVRTDSTGPQINDGNWHFVGVVFNRNATHTGVLYVDGQPAINGTGDITSVTGTNVAAAGIPLRIGAEYHTTPTYLWNGDIDEVSLITRRFYTDAEVLALYNRTLTITSDTLPAGGINVNYNQRLAGTGGVAPYTWSVAGGTLPAGLSQITPDGVLTGTPTASGTFNPTIQLADALGAITQRAFTLVINNPAPQQLLNDNFSGGAGNWHVVDQGTMEGPSYWVVSTPDFLQTKNIWDGNFLGSDPVKPGTFAFYTGALASSDYDFSVRMMAEDNDAFGVMFRYQDSNNYYRFSMDSERRYRRLVKVVGGVTTILKKSDLINNAEDNVPYEVGQVYNVRISVVGSDIFVYIDNKQILHAIDSSLPTGNKVALYTWGNEYSHFGDVLVTH